MAQSHWSALMFDSGIYNYYLSFTANRTSLGTYSHTATSLPSGNVLVAEYTLG